MIALSQAATHRGAVRQHNEDALLAQPSEGVWAVADGMGGHDAGDVAASLITESLGGVQQANRFEDSLMAMESSIQAANRSLLEASAALPRHRRPGSTVVSLLLQDGHGAVVWAGDSRLYRYRDGDLTLITRDHSQVQDLVDRGELTEDEAEAHPLAHVITRAIGFDDPAPLEVRRFEVRSGDRFLLCSDGLTRCVNALEIRAAMKRSPLGDRPRALIDLSLERGAPDNVTVVCVDCEPGA